MKKRLVTAVLVIGAFAILPSNVALAARGGNGNGNGSRGNQVNEDNDSDGLRNNISDSGDNRHPSGRDRSIENGRSGNQGNSRSDPDGLSNGGPDKPGGSGGIDRFDQDGNNGCGNDDDFEDDNNGNCGGRRVREPVAPPITPDVETPIVAPIVLPGDDDDAVSGPDDSLLQNDSLPQGVEPDARADGIDTVPNPGNSGGAPDIGTRGNPQVLGSALARGAESIDRGLPKTGAGIGTLAAIAIALMGSGLAAIEFARRRDDSIFSAVEAGTRSTF